MDSIPTVFSAFRQHLPENWALLLVADAPLKIKLRQIKFYPLQEREREIETLIDR